MTGRTRRSDRRKSTRGSAEMIDGVGREGLRRMVEHLTERIEADPRDTEALSARGLAYAELGEHRQAAEDYGRIIALDPANAGAHLDRATRLRQDGGAPPGGGGLRRRHPPGPRRRRGALQPGGVQGGAGRPGRGDERLRRGRHPGPRRRRRPLQQGIDPGGDG